MNATITSPFKTATPDKAIKPTPAEIERGISLIQSASTPPVKASGTPVKIINPENSKIIDTKIFKKANYPNIFKAVVSKKIASILELDADNPYIEIIETKKNKTFIAKEGNTFEEEKNVAGKAPVNEIKMDDLTKKDSKVEKSEVRLPEGPLRVVGEYEIELQLHSDVTVHINLAVVAE